MVVRYRYVFLSGRYGSGGDYDVFYIDLNVIIDGSGVAVSSEGY